MADVTDVSPTPVSTGTPEAKAAPTEKDVNNGTTKEKNDVVDTADSGKSTRRGCRAGRSHASKQLEEGSEVTERESGGGGGGGGNERCRQCNKSATKLYRDRTDAKLYCGPCWKRFYKKNAPQSALYHGTSSGKTKGKRATEVETPKEVGDPIAGSSAEVDSYYEDAGREGDARVFVDRDQVAWSVLLKGAKDKMKLAVIQLVQHYGVNVVFVRQGHIAEGPDANEETYEDFEGLPDAKARFERIFFDMTGNKFSDVKLCVTKFVIRRNFTLLADVKATRRAENNVNREAREAEEKKLLEERNRKIVEAAKANLAAAAAATAKRDEDVDVPAHDVENPKRTAFAAGVVDPALVAHPDPEPTTLPAAKSSAVHPSAHSSAHPSAHPSATPPERASAAPSVVADLKQQDPVPEPVAVSAVMPIVAGVTAVVVIAGALLLRRNR